MDVVTLTTANFDEEVTKSDKKVLVDFWASWCGPCRMMSPIVDEIAREVTTVKVCKINVDEEPQLAARFGIMSIPTLLVFEGGEITGRTIGAVPKQDVLNLIA